MRLTTLHKALVVSVAVHGAVGAAVLAHIEPGRRPAIGQPMVAVLEGGGPVASAPASAEAGPAASPRRERPRHLIREARAHAMAGARSTPSPAAPAPHTALPDEPVFSSMEQSPQSGNSPAAAHRERSPDEPPARELRPSREPARATRATRGSPAGTRDAGTDDPAGAPQAQPDAREERVAAHAAETAREPETTPDAGSTPGPVERGEPVTRAAGSEAAADAEESSAAGMTASRAASSMPSRAASPAAGNPVPEYPWLARRRGIEGEVVLSVEVLPSGEPERVRVESSSGHRVLDRAALESVRRWRFEPALRGGRAVPEVVRVPVRFELRRGRG